MQTLFARIAHPTDLSAESLFAFYHAVRVAVAASSKLDILHVDDVPYIERWEDFPTVSRTLASWGLSTEPLEDETELDHVRRLSPYGKEPVHPLLEYIDEYLPDMMVMATHRRQGLDRWLHKEIAQKLARSRAVSTLFVPFGDEGFVSPTKGTVNLRRILLPVDWIPNAQAAVDAAAALCEILECDDTEGTLLYVAEGNAEFPAVNLPEKADLTWRSKRREGDVLEQILAEGEEGEYDLIIMVTQGHDGFLDALRGSTTERVLGGANCPVLAVPAI